MTNPSAHASIKTFSLRAALALFTGFVFLSAFSSAGAQIWDKVTIRYNGNGADSGFLADEHYKEGTNTFTLKENKTVEGTSDVEFKKTGCKFIGWCLEPDGGTLLTPILEPGTEWEPLDVPITWSEKAGGFVFYARWDCKPGYVPTPTPRPVIYKLSYDANGGDGRLLPQSGTKNEKIKIKGIDAIEKGETSISREKYIFKTWNTSADGSGLELKTGSSIILNQDLTLYAIWEYDITQAVALRPDGENNSQENMPSQSTEGESASLESLPALRPDDGGFSQGGAALLPSKSGNNTKTLTDLSESDGADAPEKERSAEGSENESGSPAVPVYELFSAADHPESVLPRTGLTAGQGFSRSGRPASVRYTPIRMSLLIPSLDISSPIVSVEAGENGYEVEWLDMDAGLLSGTDLPGQGHSVIAAHNTLGADAYGPFAMIASLEEGERFFVQERSGSLMIFEIYDNEKIGAHDYDALYDAVGRFENTVTLLTCEDELAEGGYASRRIVSARLVDN